MSLLREKPIHFGFKWWCLCGTDGYPYDLDDDAKAPKRDEDDYGKLYEVRPLIVKLNEQFDEQEVS